MTASAHAAGEADSFALSPEQLFGATVMSVSKTSERLMDAPAAVYVLTGEDILHSGATSIPEALRLVPGVQVARLHGGGWAVSVRGFNSTLANKLLVLVDGREVYDPLFSGVYWNEQDAIFEDIERIEVIRGPGGTLWGANAVNGVINIITKHSRDTQGGLAVGLAGNQDAQGALRYGGRLSENATYRVWGKSLHRDEERRFSGLGAQDPQVMHRGGFRADWETNGGGDEFTLQGDMLQSNAHQFRVAPSTALTNIEEINTRSWNLLGRWTREMDAGERLTVQSYVDYAARRQMLIFDQRTSFDLDGQYEFAPMGRHQLIAGARYRLMLDEVTPSVSVTTMHLERHDQIFSGFVQDKITLVPDAWYLTLGSKIEHNDYSGFELQPNARLQYHIDDQRMMWGALSRAVRTPSQLEHDLTIDFLLGVLGLLPNTDFESEELIAWEMGYRQQVTPDVALDVALFYNDYDKISATSAVAGGPFIIDTSITNGTGAELYGGEAVVSWRASDRLNVSAAYSLLEIAMHGPADAVDPEDDEGRSPRHQFNVRALWNIRDDLALNTIVYRVGALPDYRAGGYWRLDLALLWQVNDAMRLTLAGQNLFSGPRHEFLSPTDSFTVPSKIEPSAYGKFTWTF